MRYFILGFACALSLGFINQYRPPKIFPVDFKHGPELTENRVWCIDQTNYIRLIKRDIELNVIIDRYELKECADNAC